MGYDTERFVNFPSGEMFICKICYDVVEEPSQCSNKHIFCFECIKLWIDKTPSCPYCEVELHTEEDLHFVSRNFKKAIDDLMVRCKFSLSGCLAYTKLGDLLAHENHCAQKCIQNSGLQRDLIADQEELRKKLESIRNGAVATTAQSADALAKKKEMLVQKKKKVATKKKKVAVKKKKLAEKKIAAKQCTILMDIKPRLKLPRLAKVAATTIRQQKLQPPRLVPNAAAEEVA